LSSFADGENGEVGYTYIEDNNNDRESNNYNEGREQLSQSSSSCDEELPEQDVPVVTEDGHVVSRMLYNNECDAVLRELDEDEEVGFTLLHRLLYSTLKNLKIQSEERLLAVNK